MTHSPRRMCKNFSAVAWLAGNCLIEARAWFRAVQKINDSSRTVTGAGANQQIHSRSGQKAIADLPIQSPSEGRRQRLRQAGPSETTGSADDHVVMVGRWMDFDSAVSESLFVVGRSYLLFHLFRAGKCHERGIGLRGPPTLGVKTLKKQKVRTDVLREATIKPAQEACPHRFVSDRGLPCSDFRLKLLIRLEICRL